MKEGSPAGRDQSSGQPQLRDISDEALSRILAFHRKWLESEGKESTRANLTRARLRKADLRVAKLREADMRRAYLRVARLQGADLRDDSCRRSW